MAPFDGAMLGRVLAVYPDGFPAAVKEYVRDVSECASAAVRMSACMQEALTSPNARQRMLAFFQPS